MYDDRNFQKKLAKLQIQATIVAVILGIIISLGIVLLSFSMTLEVKPIADFIANMGIVIILISLGIAVLLLRSYYKSVDHIDKGSHYYQ